MLEALGPVIALIVKSILELFVEKASAPITVVDAVCDPGLRKRLRERLRETRGDSTSG